MEQISSKQRLIIIGASGHGKVIADIARLNGYKDILFFDDDIEKKFCGKYPVQGQTKDALITDGDVFIAIGNSEIRSKLFEQIQNRVIPVLIHPNATVAEDTSIGAGTVIMAGAVINAGTTIGKGCIINTCASVDHDCIVKNYVHVAVGAHLCGTVIVGTNTWIGAGATVINDVNVCGGCIIGAGAVVVKDIKATGTYIGIPSKKAR